jgi:hypothetical protein
MAMSAVYELHFSVLNGSSEISKFENAVREVVPDILNPLAEPDERFGMAGL